MFTRKLIVKSSLLIVNCLILLTIISYLLPTAHAQAPVPSGTGQAPSYAPLPSNISPTSPIFTDLILQNTFHSFSCLAVGSSIIGQPCLTYQVTKNAQGMIQSVPVLSQTNLSGGALGAATSIIGGLYLNPPIRTASYLASVGEGMGIIKVAHAQVIGSGAGVLDPILKLWQVSRNISYLVMIIIFVIIGLMVMFRQRINPQTVITAQAALPGLVIGLILITFSYFLASLITDVSFLGVNVVGAYFSAAQPGSAAKTVQDISTQNVGTMFSKFVGIVTSGDISDIINSVLNSLDGGVQFWVKMLAGIIGFQTGSSFGGPIGALGGATICASTGIGVVISPFCAGLVQLAGQAAIGGILGGIAFNFPGETFGLVLYFVAIAILIYTMFKLLLKLINNYLSIIFLTVSAPFQFLAASLPGRQSITTGWILNMLCNVLSFPAVFAVFYFAAYLVGPSQQAGQLFNITTQLNLTGNQTLPLFGGLNLNFIRILLAFGALMATPTIPDIICRAIGRVGQAGQLIGQEISGGARSGQGYAGRFGAVPGQLGGSLGKYGQEFGPKTSIVPGGSTGAQVARTRGLFGGPQDVRPLPKTATPPITPP